MSLTQEYRPTKPRTPGTEADVITRTIREIGTPKDLAARLGKSASLVAAWGDPDARARIPYQQVREAVELGARAPVMDLCNLAGGAFVAMGAQDAHLSELMVKVTREFSEALSASISMDPSAGPIPRATAMRLMGEYQDLIGAAAQAIACIASRMEQSESGGPGQ